MKYSMITLLAIALWACMEEDAIVKDPGDNSNDLSRYTITLDQTQYDAMQAQIANDEPVASDPFELHDAWLEGTDLKVFVSYSGGCEEHDFELIWPEAITYIFPPDFDVVLTHDANGDMCEAYPSDTLTFDLSGNGLVSDDVLPQMDLGIINGSNPDEIVKVNE